MNTSEELKAAILRMDRRGYPAYKSLAGSWRFPEYVLNIDHVQGDPFASPSALSVRIDGKRAGFPAEFLETKCRKTALEDQLTRRFFQETGRLTERAKGSGKSGLIQSSRPGQEILERTACRVRQSDGEILFRFFVGFPAFGRSIAAGELVTILFEMLPKVIRAALFFHREEAQAFQRVLDLADDQLALRDFLKRENLAAFVADGAVLPRESGISQRPMKDAVPFRSPDTLRVTAELPHAGKVAGMGISRGVTLIVGGGYHGKSTLLDALQLGVYNHIAGDGREYVVTDETAVKLRAEDGRSVKNTDISLFIDHLPGGRRGTDFSTENASGSTSQAANTVEAIEAGSRVFLIDEDTCATNFMVRDALMERVVQREQEPITPFLDRIRPLFEEAGISTILAAGSSGLYFAPADTVIQMKDYMPYDITERAKAAVREAGEKLRTDDPPGFRTDVPKDSRTAVLQDSGNDVSQDYLTEHSALSLPSFRRSPRPGRFSDRVKVKTGGIESFLLDHDEVRLGQLEQIADREQTAALAYCLLYLEERIFDGKRTLREAAQKLQALLEQQGLEALSPGQRTVPMLAMPRPQEILACVTRYRGLRF